MRLAYVRAIAVSFLLIGCAEPLPTDKAAYVGDWQAKDMRLLITQEGRVVYERREGSSSKSIKAPLQRFEGDNFAVGIGMFTTVFVVSKPPHQDGAVWKMTVDGVELVRRGGGRDDLRA